MKNNKQVFFYLSYKTKQKKGNTFVLAYDRFNMAVIIWNKKCRRKSLIEKFEYPMSGGSLAVLSRLTGRWWGWCRGDEVGTGWCLTGLESSLVSELSALSTEVALDAGVLTDLSWNLFAMLTRNVLAAWLRKLFAVRPEVLSVTDKSLVTHSFAHLNK